MRMSESNRMIKYDEVLTLWSSSRANFPVVNSSSTQNQKLLLDNGYKYKL